MIKKRMKILIKYETLRPLNLKEIYDTLEINDNLPEDFLNIIKPKRKK